MAYKWRPSAAQRREFAQRMQDPAEVAAYEARKAERAANRRAKSKFDYNTAGGNYIPTQLQYQAAINALNTDITDEQKSACDMVIFGYTCKEKVHHDHIHIVNEIIRKESGYAL